MLSFVPENQVLPGLRCVCSGTYLGPPFLIQLHRHQGRRALLAHGWLAALPEEVDTLLFASHPDRVFPLLPASHCKHKGPQSVGWAGDKLQEEPVCSSGLQTEDKQQRRSPGVQGWGEVIYNGGHVDFGWPLEEKETTFLPANGPQAGGKWSPDPPDTPR